MTQADNGDLVLRHGWLGELPMHIADPRERGRYFADILAPSRGYTPPVRIDDGWDVATAEEASIDRAALDALVMQLSSGNARDLNLVHSILVSHRGKLIVDEYFYGHDRDTVHDVRSLSKVFGSILAGAARQNGIEVSPDDPVVANALGNDPGAAAAERRAITVRHAMTYTSGLDCSGAGDEDAMWSQMEVDDYWLITARQRVLHPVGERYEYCSGSANLVGSAIARASGERVQDLFYQLVASPLDLATYHWDVMPTGQGYLGGGVYLRPRDLLKIGALYAAGGVWNAQRIIPAEWIAESTAPIVPINLQTTGMTQEEYDNHYAGGSQGYI